MGIQERGKAVTPLDIGLWVTVVILAVLAGRMSMPDPPELDWKDFFALAVASQVRGEVDQEKGDFKEWVKRCEPLLGRGEVDLVYDDPLDFGPAYALERTLGVGVNWEMVAVDREAVIARIALRNENLLWVIRGDAMCAELQAVLPQTVVLDAPIEALPAELDALLKEASTRLVLVGEGSAAFEWTQLLHQNDGLRDRTLAVVGIDGQLGGENGVWLMENFTHDAMDTELERLTPWMQLAFSGDHGPPDWPQPEIPSSERLSVDSIGLGPLPAKRQDAPDSIWGLALVLTCLHRIAIES